MFIWLGMGCLLERMGFEGFDARKWAWEVEVKKWAKELGLGGFLELLGAHGF
jgi:hypothetical protein